MAVPSRTALKLNNKTSFFLLSVPLPIATSAPASAPPFLPVHLNPLLLPPLTHHSQLWRNNLIRVFKNLYQLGRFPPILSSKQTDSSPLSPRSPSPAHSVHIVLHIPGEVVVYNVCDPFNVQTTTSNVCSDQNGDIPLFETSQCCLPVRLVSVPVDSVTFYTSTSELGSHVPVGVV